VIPLLDGERSPIRIEHMLNGGDPAGHIVRRDVNALDPQLLDEDWQIAGNDRHIRHHRFLQNQTQPFTAGRNQHHIERFI